MQKAERTDKMHKKLCKTQMLKISEQHRLEKSANDTQYKLPRRACPIGDAAWGQRDPTTPLIHDLVHGKQWFFFF